MFLKGQRQEMKDVYEANMICWNVLKFVLDLTVITKLDSNYCSASVVPLMVLTIPLLPLDHKIDLEYLSNVTVNYICQLHLFKKPSIEKLI